MLFFIFFITITTSFLIAYVLEKFFLKKKLFIDKPSLRKTHKHPVPTAGGISILFSFLVFVFLLNNFYEFDINLLNVLAIAILPIMIVGLIDDYNEINIYIRLFAQFFSAALIIYFFQIKNNALDVNLYTQTPYIIIFISIILSVWLMNLFNFMDGIDGYTASQSVFVSFSASIVAYINSPENFLFIILLGLGFSNLGFLLRNWYPAKIFMGDTGSVSIGCIIAFFIFYSASESLISIYTWLILLSIFIADSTYTLIVRIVTKKNILKPHLTHGFHILTKNRNSQLFTTKCLIILNTLWVLPLAILSNIFMNFHIIITFIAYLPLLMYLIKIGAGLENQEIK